jgi:hypothetical protein
VRVNDPYKAASKPTQRLVVVAMIAAFVAYIVISGGGGLFLFPIGAFLLLAAGYVIWGWWSERGETPPA